MDNERLKAMGAKVVMRGEPTYLLPDPTTPVIYTNSAQVRVSIHDFMLLLGLADPSSPDLVEIRPVARIIMSPQHAKALAIVLTQNVNAYEAAFGEIQTERKVAEPENPEHENGT